MDQSQPTAVQAPSLEEQLTNEISIAKVNVALRQFGLPSGKYEYTGFFKEIGSTVAFDLVMKNTKVMTRVLIRLRREIPPKNGVFVWSLKKPTGPHGGTDKHVIWLIQGNLTAA